MGKKLRIPVEAILGALFFIIVIGLVAVFWSSLFPGMPSEEVCDLIDNDLDGEVDEGFSTTCSADSDCGPTGTYGQRYCKSSDVYRAGYESVCMGEIGSCDSECINRQTEVLVERCKTGCERGECV